MWNSMPRRSAPAPPGGIDGLFSSSSMSFGSPRPTSNPSSYSSQSASFMSPAPSAGNSLLTPRTSSFSSETFLAGGSSSIAHSASSSAYISSSIPSSSYPSSSLPSSSLSASMYSRLPPVSSILDPPLSSMNPNSIVPLSSSSSQRQSSPTRPYGGSSAGFFGSTFPSSSSSSSLYPSNRSTSPMRSSFMSGSSNSNSIDNLVAPLRQFISELPSSSPAVRSGRPPISEMSTASFSSPLPPSSSASNASRTPYLDEALSSSGIAALLRPSSAVGSNSFIAPSPMRAAPSRPAPGASSAPAPSAASSTPFLSSPLPQSISKPSPLSSSASSIPLRPDFMASVPAPQPQLPPASSDNYPELQDKEMELYSLDLLHSIFSKLQVSALGPEQNDRIFEDYCNLIQAITRDSHPVEKTLSETDIRRLCVEGHLGLPQHWAARSSNSVPGHSSNAVVYINQQTSATAVDHPLQSLLLKFFRYQWALVKTTGSSPAASFSIPKAAPPPQPITAPALQPQPAASADSVSRITPSSGPLRSASPGKRVPFSSGPEAPSSPFGSSPRLSRTLSSEPAANSAASPVAVSPVAVSLLSSSAVQQPESQLAPAEKEKADRQSRFRQAFMAKTKEMASESAEPKPEVPVTEADKKRRFKKAFLEKTKEMLEKGESPALPEDYVDPTAPKNSVRVAVSDIRNTLLKEEEVLERDLKAGRDPFQQRYNKDVVSTFRMPPSFVEASREASSDRAASNANFLRERKLKFLLKLPFESPRLSKLTSSSANQDQYVTADHVHSNMAHLGLPKMHVMIHRPEMEKPFTTLPSI